MMHNEKLPLFSAERDRYGPPPSERSYSDRPSSYSSSQPPASSYERFFNFHLYFFLFLSFYSYIIVVVNVTLEIPGMHTDHQVDIPAQQLHHHHMIATAADLKKSQAVRNNLTSMSVL